MSNDETNAYLQAKMQQAQGGQELSEPQKKTQTSKVKGNKAETQPEHLSVDLHAFQQIVESVVRTELQTTLSATPPVVDMRAVRQVIEDVVRAELRVTRPEQPQPPDLHALQHMIRAELQSIQTTLTLLTQAVQAQTDALMQDDQQEEEEQEQDEPLGTVDTDDQEDEQQNVFPPDNQDEEEIDDDEKHEEQYPAHPPRPVPPTHRLRREGPLGILLGLYDSPHPITGTRRWESNL